MTGADSPVIADSSTDATPSMISPSDGMNSPAFTITTSSLRRLVAGTVSIVPPAPIRLATVSVRALRSVSACAFPRPSAIASAKLAKSTVSQSQNVICSSKPSPGRPVDRIDQQPHRRQHAADLDDEHHRVLRHRARMQLANRVDDRGPDDRRIPDRS